MQASCLEIEINWYEDLYSATDCVLYKFSALHPDMWAPLTLSVSEQ